MEHNLIKVFMKLNFLFFLRKFMEDGEVDTIVIESRQHKMGWMADFPPLLAFSVFDL